MAALSIAMVSTVTDEYIYEEAQLLPLSPPPPNLRELNSCLDALVAVFPDVRVEVFREMLTHFDGESRLAVVADALLKNRTAWVKGRWRDTTIDSLSTSAPLAFSTSVPARERFRSLPFQLAVRKLALTEFKGLSKSTIHAVLAEVNYSYLDARPTLVSISAKSWRFALSSLLFRRRNPSATTAGPGTNAGHDLENCPLVVWRSTGRGSIMPSIRGTGCAELDAELYAALVAPLRCWTALSQVADDRALALLLVEDEAERLDLMLECECCYGTVLFEKMTSCSSGGHLVCFDCVRHTTAEAVFGQGWQSSVNRRAGSLKCLSADITASGCQGCVPRELLRRALAEPLRPPPRPGSQGAQGHSASEEARDQCADLLARLDRRLAEFDIVDSGLPLVRCPFCDYAEVDEVYLPNGAGERLRVQANSAHSLFFLVLCLGLIPFLLPVVALTVAGCLMFNSKRTLGDGIQTEWRRAVNRARRRRRGARFVCGAGGRSEAATTGRAAPSAPTGGCGRASCLLCGKGWADVHVCHESSLVALRTQVEQAMSMAVKRVCPRCGTSFVKTAGCNKLTCPCGYKMCYLCRADLATDGYRHFCPHFRPDGHASAAPCRECDRCSLWEAEDTDGVLRRARADAEHRWREAERRDLTPQERAYLETGVASSAPATSAFPPRSAKAIAATASTSASSWLVRQEAGLLARLLRVPTLTELCDVVVEHMYY